MKLSIAIVALALGVARALPADNKKDDSKSENKSDNSTYKLRMPPIRDEGDCGSCVGFAFVAAAEGAVLKKHPELGDIDFSEKGYFFCDGQRKCRGGWKPYEAGMSLMEKGLYYERDIPYDTNPKCDMKKVNGTKRAPYKFGVRRIYWTDDVKDWIKSDGPVVVGVDYYSDFPQKFTEKKPPADYVYKRGANATADPRLHAVTLIGWDDKKEAWLVRNSFGPKWNGDGNIWVKYGEMSTPDPRSRINYEGDMFVVSVQ